MRHPWKSVLGLCVTGMGLGASALALGASGVGPYYATPSWDQTLPAFTRFIVLTNMNSEAVLDRETGLVWERAPDSTARTWVSAQAFCNDRIVGNRKGWRLPTIQELASLVDPSVPLPGPTLPAGHPFTNVQSGPTPLSDYWSATSAAFDAAAAWLVYFNHGSVNVDFKSVDAFVWCVRGGQGVDVQ